MIVSAGAALTAAILLTPGAQAAPPFKPEDDFSATPDGVDSADDVDKDVVNDLADEWSSSDDADKKGSEEEDMLPPDDQQDLSAMTEEDLTVGNDDDDILDSNEGNDDSIFITSAEEETDETKTEDTQAFKAGVLDADQPVDPLADDKVTDKDGGDWLLGLEDNDGKEDDVIPLSEEDALSTDGDAEETDDLFALDDPEESALEETPEDEPVESELLQGGDEDAEGTQDSELAVESPWDEQQSLQQDKDEESKPIPDDGLDIEETPLDVEETPLDAEETPLDAEETPLLDGEETSLLDSEKTPVSDADFLGNYKDGDLESGLDLDAATEYKEEHQDDNDYNTPVNDDGEIGSPVVESPEGYTPFADPPVDDDSQLTQDPEELDILPSSEDASESDLLTDEYQVDTTIQEINDSFEKALDAVQPDNSISSPEDADSFNELVGAANDPSQAGFFPAENENKSALIGEDSGSSTLNMLLVLAVLVLLLFKLPKIKRWLGCSPNDQSSLPYHVLRKRSQD